MLFVACQAYYLKVQNPVEKAPTEGACRICHMWSQMLQSSCGTIEDLSMSSSLNLATEFSRQSDKSEKRWKGQILAR